MAIAIIKGISSTYDITILGRNEEKLVSISKTYNTKYKVINSSYDITDLNILIAIKPQAMDFLSNFKGNAKNIFSILAGKSIKSIKKYISSKTYTRVMPNISALYNSSITALYSDGNDKQTSEEIFSSIGNIIWMDKESDINSATIIGSSAIAYLALISEAFEDAGVNEGLSRDKSRALVLGLFKGFPTLLEKYKPSDIKDMVMSPNGTTAKGYAVLEKRAIRGAIIEATTIAHDRAKELA